MSLGQLLGGATQNAEPAVKKVEEPKAEVVEVKKEEPKKAEEVKKEEPKIEVVEPVKKVEEPKVEVEVKKEEPKVDVVEVKEKEKEKEPEKKVQDVPLIEETIVHSGELEKMGGSFMKKWQPRKFELTEEKLRWFVPGDVSSLFFPFFFFFLLLRSNPIAFLCGGTTMRFFSGRSATRCC